MRYKKAIVSGLFVGAVLAGSVPAVGTLAGNASMQMVADAARSSNEHYAEFNEKLQAKISDPKYKDFLADSYFTSDEFRAPIVEGLKNEEGLEKEKQRILDTSYDTFAKGFPLTRGVYGDMEREVKKQRSIFNDDTYKMLAIVDAERVCEGGNARSETVKLLAKKYLCPTT